MYFVDREKIEEKLKYIDNQIKLFEQQKSWDSMVEKTALERVIHMTMEAILDVGNGMIDGFIMRDPGSYEDIIDILEDENVITSEMSQGYKRLVPFRKSLQQYYTSIDHKELLSGFQRELPYVKDFSQCVLKYLEKELEVVTAFKPSN